MNKPVVFHPLDAVALAFPGLVTLGFGIWLALAGTKGAALTIVTALCFLGIYTWVLIARKQLIDSYPIVTKYHVLIKPNGYQITKEQAEEAIQQMILAYEVFWPRSREALTKDYTWVEFVPGVIEINEFGKRMLVAGFLRAWGRSVKVGYFNAEHKPDPTVPLNRTALTHELGHIILGGVLGVWDEAQHHAIMQEKRLH